MNVEHHIEGGYDILAPIGELDLSNYTPLREAIGELIASGRAHLVIDLSRTEFLDSTALGALVAARRQTQAANGSLAVICNHPQVRRLFTITGLDSAFEMWQTLDQWRAETRSSGT